MWFIPHLQCNLARYSWIWAANWSSHFSTEEGTLCLIVNSYLIVNTFFISYLIVSTLLSWKAFGKNWWEFGRVHNCTCGEVKTLLDNLDTEYLNLLLYRIGWINLPISISEPHDGTDSHHLLWSIDPRRKTTLAWNDSARITTCICCVFFIQVWSRSKTQRHEER